jgi:hypothetical protein
MGSHCELLSQEDGLRHSLPPPSRFISLSHFSLTVNNTVCLENALTFVMKYVDGKNGSLCQVPQGNTPIRSITTSTDTSLAVVANNTGNCYVWNLNGPAQSNDVPDFSQSFQAHDGYALKCLLSSDAK